MKNILYLLLLLPVLFVACKKKTDKPAVFMAMVVNRDTVWKTTELTTDNQNNGNVYITGINAATDERIALTITDFIEGKKAYYIDYRGTGGNIKGSIATYSKGSNLYYASTGNIYVTSVTGNTINGSFDLNMPTQRITGVFTAAKH